jgi:hypothetical protein
MTQKNRPTLAFATMCKNEEHIIGTVLEAVAPYIDYHYDMHQVIASALSDLKKYHEILIN